MYCIDEMMDEFFERIFKVINLMKQDMAVEDSKLDLLIQRHIQFMTHIMESGTES